MKYVSLFLCLPFLLLGQTPKEDASNYITKKQYIKAQEVMMDYILEHPLDKEALELLENNQAIQISEIAYQTGFSSPTYFSKCFNEVYGILPSKYNL